MKPILLVLSTRRQSELLVQQSIEIARQEARNIIILFVVDTCQEFELIHSQTFAGTHFRQRCQEELLRECRAKAEATVNAIVSQAAEAGVACETIVKTGQFDSETLRIIREREPAKVTLARGGRPRWIWRLLGLPVNHIAGRAPCQVLEYGNTRIF